MHLKARRHAGAGGRLAPARRLDPVDLLDRGRSPRRLGLELQPRDVAVRVGRCGSSVQLLHLRRTQHVVHGKGGRGGVDEEVVPGRHQAGGDLRHGDFFHGGSDVGQHAADGRGGAGEAGDVVEGGEGADGDGGGSGGGVGAGVVLGAAADGDEGEGETW